MGQLRGMSEIALEQGRGRKSVRSGCSTHGQVTFSSQFWAHSVLLAGKVPRSGTFQEVVEAQVIRSSQKKKSRDGVAVRP